MSIHFTEIPVIRPSLGEELDIDYLSTMDPELLDIVLDIVSDVDLRRFCVINKRVWTICQANPTLKKRLEDVRSQHFAASLHYWNHAMAYVNRNGDLFVIGENKKGRLGIGSIRRKSKWIPTKVHFTRPVKYVTLSEDLMGVITREGKVYLSGNGAKGKLGDPTIKSTKTLIPLGKGQKVWEERAFQLELLDDGGRMLTENGVWWEWGTPWSGRKEHVEPIKLRSWEIVALDAENNEEFTLTQEDTTITQFAYRWYVTNFGTIHNRSGVTFYSDIYDPVIQLEATFAFRGRWYTYLTVSGSLYMHGHVSGSRDYPMGPITFEGLKIPLPEGLHPILFAVHSMALVVLTEEGEVVYWWFRHSLEAWMRGEIVEPRKINTPELPAPVKQIYVEDIDHYSNANRIFLVLENGDVYYEDIGEISRNTKPELEFAFGLTRLVDETEDATTFEFLNKETVFEK